MARLRKEEEARQYERMINPPPQVETFAQRFPNASLPNLSNHPMEEDMEITFADINRQVTLIFNILFSIVACSVAIWMVAGHWDTPRRLGLSMGGGGVVGIAEVVVYMGYLRRITEAKEKERKKLETKEIVDTWVLEPTKKTKDETQTIKLINPVQNPQESIRKRNKHATGT
jgi:TMEM199 family protein